MADAAGFSVLEPRPGVRLYLRPDPRFKRVALSVFVEQRLRPETAADTALLPRVLRRGTASYPQTLSLERALADLYGASLDPGVLKVGERHVMELSLSLPGERYVGERGLLDRGAALLAEVLRRPVRREGDLEAAYVQQESRELARQIRALLDSKSAYARWRCVEEMCRDEPYGTYHLGSVDAVARADPGRLARYHRDLLAAHPVSVYAWGPFEPERVAETLSQRFAWPRAEQPLAFGTGVEDRPAAGAPRQVEEARPMTQAWLVLGYRTGVTRADDAFYAMTVANDLFGGSVHSRLFTNVREKASLAYAAGSSFDAGKGILLVVAGIDPARREQAQAVIEEQVEDLRQGGAREQELQVARAHLRQLRREREDRPGAAIAAHLAGRIGGRLDTLEEAVARVEAVERGQVADAMRRLRLDTVFFLHPDGGGD